jgi:outer membrane protein OmpA-like peptidoglycan-associated protein
LSQRRAESAVSYIVSKGISENRMTAKGYGESKLIIPNAKTEKEHQINRRTEFKVTSYEFIENSEDTDTEEKFFNNN